ncbi:interleukin-1 receptor type 2-like isoform X2 [Narcine bancroftii]|uniref:interleukin-1 receptor type 2-like isoform X2 n=1 Tax=Narcine bancroftii TaxID=1343680 RepID=UPI003831CECD
MIVLLAAFISLSPSISSSKVCASSAQHINTSGLSIQILYPCNNSIEAVAGSKLEITCRVLAELHMGKILMYWLANHTYIEDYSKSNRVKEIRTEQKGTEKSYLEVTLSFSKVERKDFEINFACIILSVEIDQETFISIKPIGCSHGPIPRQTSIFTRRSSTQ